MKSRWDLFKPETAWEPWKPDAGQPWDFARAAHLYRRAAFGAPWSEISDSVQEEHSATIARLLEVGDTENSVSDDDRTADVLAASSNSRQLAAWWMLRMAKTVSPALERATLFWHGHFATSAAKVEETRLMLAQYRLLRQYALGKFEPMVQGIACDPAMLVYLDSRESRRANPNENFARELMELFCLGTGNYTENDIREMAKCFTGFEIRYGKYRFNSFQHDKGEKAYLGQRGNHSGDDTVRIVVGHPACPGFLVGKLLRYYVADDFPSDSPLIEPLAREYRDSGLDTGILLRKLVSSRLFFSDEAMASRISSPVEMIVGLLRAFRIEANMQTLADSVGELGQLPFFPPSVKGWKGGTSWINAQTLMGRANLVNRLMDENKSRFRPDFPAFASGDPVELVDQTCQLLLANPLPETVRSSLIATATSAASNSRDRLAGIVSVLAAMPEFHLG